MWLLITVVPHSDPRSRAMNTQKMITQIAVTGLATV